MVVDELDSLDEGRVIEVEVVFADVDQQELMTVRVPSGSTIDAAITASEIQNLFPQIDLSKKPVGIFGKKARRETVLKQGDRVEIYRALTADPKEVRRALAALGKTMGKTTAKKT